MRVLAFSDAFWPHVGGIETFLLQLSSYLHARGVEVAVAARYTRHEGASPFPFPVYWRPKDDKLMKLVDWCDVLHLNSMHVGMLLRAVRKRKKIVTTNHDATMICPKGVKLRHDGPCLNRAGPIVCTWCLKRSGTPEPWRRLVRPPLKALLSVLIDANVVTSPWAMRCYKLSHKRLIPLGIDLDRFSPPPENRLVDHDRRLPRAIFVGRLVPEKGAAVAIEALRHCRAAGRPFELVICGNGPSRPELEATVDAHGLRSLVHFRGTVVGSELIAALRAADVAVVPSVCEEPFGLTAVEAMGCGLPVIAADSGGLGSIVAQIAPELIVARGCPAQLAERLQALLANPARRRALGERARQLVLENYDVRQMLRAYYELFTRITHERRMGAST